MFDSLKRMFSATRGGGHSMHTAKVVFRGVQEEGGKTYRVSTAPTRQDAMEYLRRTLVTEPRVYEIVETPQGNLGKDVIGIFDEADGKPIEFGQRPASQDPITSRTHCTRCGHFVFPTKAMLKGATVHYYLNMEDIRGKGAGFFCRQCGVVWCAFCATLSGKEVPCPICKTSMLPYQEE